MGQGNAVFYGLMGIVHIHLKAVKGLPSMETLTAWGVGRVAPGPRGSLTSSLLILFFMLPSQPLHTVHYAFPIWFSLRSETPVFFGPEVFIMSGRRVEGAAKG